MALGFRQIVEKHPALRKDFEQVSKDHVLLPRSNNVMMSNQEKAAADS